MKFISRLLFIILICLARHIACTQECGNCKKTPKVNNYDLEVQVPKPDDTSKLLQWRQLFWLSEFAKSYLFERNKNCVRFVQPLSTNANGNEVLVVSQTDPQLPASGNVSKYGDYLVTGFVRQSGEGYIMHMELQTSCSRKKVAASDVPFQLSSDPDYISGIGQQAAASLTPLIDKINEFAKKQRETDKGIAFSNWGKEAITIVPKKQKLAAGEETEIEIIMKDCDGYALGNREIDLSKGSINGMPINGTTGGTVTPSKVITDAGGKAKAKFKMGNEKTAFIRAHYLFNRPTGCADAMIGSCALGAVPVKLSIEYAVREESTFTPSDVLPGAMFEGGKDHSRFWRIHWTDLYYFPEGPKDKHLVQVGNPELRSRTIYEDEIGEFNYSKHVGASATVIDVPGIVHVRDNEQKEESESNSGFASPGQGVQIDFFLGDEIEAMYFSLAFIYKNELDENRAGIGGFTSGVTLRKGDKGVSFSTNKITDPQSPYKTEYIITCDRNPRDISGLKDLGVDADKVDALAGGIAQFYKYEGREQISVRILSPY
jgi:hypothetical protein